MAIFNKREVGYIKAIAGVGKHKSFVNKRWFGSLGSNGVQLTAPNAETSSLGNSRVDYASGQTSDIQSKKLSVFALALNKAHVSVDASDTSDDPNVWVHNAYKTVAGLTSSSTNGTGTDGNMVSMEGLTLPMVSEADDGKVDENGDVVTAPQITPTTVRVGTEYFLDKTTLKMRFTMPDFGLETSNLKPHFEYRLIMFRNRKPVKAYGDERIRTGASYLNFQYDLFNGPVGRPIGFRGWRGRQDFDGHEQYRGMTLDGNNKWALAADADLGEPGAPDRFTVDEWMVMPLNSADYIILKDERFFLGTEHGKSHYEIMESFNWREQGETEDDDLTFGLRENFNSCIYFMLLGTSNDSEQPNLNMVFTQTTCVESA